MEPPIKPLSSKFATNYAPTEDEVLQIKALLSVPLAQVAQIQDRMAQIKSKIAELQKQYSTWEGACSVILRDASVDSYQALLAPIRRLPPEILHEIFLFTTPSNHYALITRNEAPISLTQTCRLWRRIAVKIPPLWSTIHIPVSSQTPEGLRPISVKNVIERRMQALKRWIKRSQNHPFDFAVYDPGTQVPVLEPRKRLFGLLCSVSKRWRRVRVYSSLDVLQGLARLRRADVPLLEEFEVHTDLAASTVRGPGEIVVWGESKLLAAPRLQRFGTNTISESVRKFKLPYRQLTHLELGHGLLPTMVPYLSVSRLAWILQMETKLVSGSFTVSGASFELPEERINLPELKSLVVMELGHDVDCSELFSQLVVPKLKRLIYHSCPAVQTRDFPSYASLPAILSAAGTGATLESLEVNGLMFPTQESLIECMRSLTSIRTLKFIESTPSSILRTPFPGAHFDDTLLDTLISSSTTDIANVYLLPKLEHLKIEYVTNFTDKAICEFLGFRSGALPGVPVSPLKSFAVVVNDERLADGGVESQMRHLVKEGLELAVSYRRVRPSRQVKGTLVGSAPAFSARDGLLDFGCS